MKIKALIASARWKFNWRNETKMANVLEHLKHSGCQCWPIAVKNFPLMVLLHLKQTTTWQSEGSGVGLWYTWDMPAIWGLSFVTPFGLPRPNHVLKLSAFWLVGELAGGDNGCLPKLLSEGDLVETENENCRSGVLKRFYGTDCFN